MRLFLGQKTFSILSLVILICWDLLVMGQNSRSEKPPIDTSVLGKWPLLNSPTLSRTGRFLSYAVWEGRRGMQKLTLVIMDSSGSWRRSFVDASRCFFSKDERLIIFPQKDNLHLLALGLDKPDSVIETNSYQVSQDNDVEWLAYRQKNDSDQVKLLNLITGERRVMGRFAEFIFDKKGEFLFATDTSNGETALYVFQLPGNKGKRIWVGSKNEVPSNFVVDDSAKKIVYLVDSKENDMPCKSIWYYEVDKERAELKIKDGDVRIDSSLQIEGMPIFGKGGKWIFFSLKKQKQSDPKSRHSDPMVDIWGYRDRLLPPEQLLERRNGSERFLAILNSESNGFYRLERDGEKVVTSDLDYSQVVVIERPETFDTVGFDIDQKYRCFYDIVSLKDGARTLLRKDASSLESFALSPMGGWLVYYDLYNKIFSVMI